MKTIDAFISALNENYLWGPPMLVLLLGTHLFLTIRLRGIQRYIPLAIKLSFGRSKEGEGDVSQFGALMTALAATIGTGNIIGVAAAVSAGGPGAVFWCWMTGVLGIATKYGEALLAVKYRVHTPDGHMLGGPMYALERGLKMKWAGVLFAIFTTIAAFGIGNIVQANSLAQRAQSAFGVPCWVSGLVMMTLTAIVILGGIKSIANVCSALVPFMAIFYIVGSLIILATGASQIPHTIALIFKSAFTGQAAVGGFLGSTIMIAARWGVARGLFSNESGLGSAPIVAAAAQTKNPVRQALVSSTGTFWDTVVVCAITGLVLVNTGVWKMHFEGGAGALTEAAFGTVHVLGPIVLTVALATFVFSTILGWSYYGEKALEYLVGRRAILPYRIIWVGLVMVGSISTPSLVWGFADAANALMALPNLLSLLLLSGVIVAETRKYLWEGDLDAVAPVIPITSQKRTHSR
ncbi:MAG: alanine/glycine:cation symporter family protein [Armatimonadota bacterium]